MVLPAMEGSRPVLVEVQALVAPSELEAPRRVANGIDRNRLSLVLAVLSRHARLSLGKAPTCSSTSPAACGSTSPAPTSRWRWRSPRRTEASPCSAADGKPLACFGELGLTGELRYVGHPDRRVAEARKFGLGPVLGPAGGETLDGLDAHTHLARCAERGARQAQAGRRSRRRAARSGLTAPKPSPYLRLRPRRR